VLGGIQLSVDGKPVALNETMAYKGMMYSGVPNLASCVGYTNASWTLKVDLTCAYVCRLMNHLDRTGRRFCTPQVTDPTVVATPWLDFTSGYVQRPLPKFRKPGPRSRCRLSRSTLLASLTLKLPSVEAGSMVFAP